MSWVISVHHTPDTSISAGIWKKQNTRGLFYIDFSNAIKLIIKKTKKKRATDSQKVRSSPFILPAN